MMKKKEVEDEEHRLKVMEQNISKLFVPYYMCLQLKEIGFDELCLASYYTDIDENKFGDCDYRKQFVPLEYHPLDSFGAEWEPHFIRNTKSTYYVSAPTWDQVELFFEKCGYIFTLNSTFDDNNNKIVCYWFDIFKRDIGFVYESEFIFERDKSKQEVKELMFEKIIEDIKK